MCDNLCNVCGVKPRYKGLKLCATCRTRLRRANDPTKAAYTNLKQNAKRRGHSFDITFDQFKAFCIATDYIVNKGIYKESYSLDRIDPTKGYTLDNLQVMSVSENSRKSNKVVYDIRTKEFTVLSYFNIPHSNGPF